MKSVLLSLTLLFCQCRLATAGAPTVPESKSGEDPSSPLLEEDNWQTTLTPYGWLVNLDGTLGIRGFTTPLDIGFDDILNNLDMVALLNLEVQKGRWGGWIDFGYLDMSVGGNPSGPLFDSVGISMEMALVEGAAFYRLLQNDRGVLDVYAGARYFYLGGSLELHVSDAGLKTVSQDLSRSLLDKLRAGLQTGDNPISDAISEKASGAESKLNDLRQIAAAHPELAEKIRNSPAINEAVANLSAAVKSNIAEAVTEAEKQLAEEIAKDLDSGIPDAISGSYDWVDPFVGIRARYNFTDRLYAVGKAEIGGFGVGSDMTWQAYGAIGYSLTKSGNTTLEVGYRHMDVDYEDGGLLFDARMSGAMVSLGFSF